MNRARYQSLTIKRKLEIIDKVDSLPPGKKKKDIAAECDIPPSTLSTIQKNRDSLLAKHALGSNKKKHYREPTGLEVDAALFQWSTTVESWTCSSGWLSRWKVRHNIKFRSICGKNAAVDQEVCDDWKQRKLLPVLRRYDPSDVFNADETGLYWRLLPDKTHAITGEVCTGGKKSKERVTVLVCANMSGSEKLPLLTIGKFKKPRCFRGVTCLPTEYEANTSAWMTSVVF